MCKGWGERAQGRGMWYNQNEKTIFAFPAKQEQSMLEHKIIEHCGQIDDFVFDFDENLKLLPDKPALLKLSPNLAAATTQLFVNS